ncbi:MAG: hypothetical protein ACR2RB_17385 [Gammaproteobacteria bacterium]
MRLNTVPRIGAVCLAALIVSGCARSLPLISHAHIGHALTAWRDTPGEAGLFVVAEQEAEIALAQASLAVQAKGKPITTKRHIANVAHALSPDAHPQGTGLGYGAIRALRSAADHITFSAESGDASANIVTGAAHFVEAADAVVKRFQVALEIAQVARLANASELPGLAAELEQLTRTSIHGEDLNNDGIVGSKIEEFGLEQLRTALSDMIGNEKPAYHPLGRQYLFGLVRLPNGGWAYRFDSSGDPPTSGYGQYER